MKKTTITIDRRFRIGEVDPRVFGGFLEHLGRAVYEGVYDPDSTLADADGWRQDVLSALDRLRFTAMRYPGGNFASGYHWQDGVGPKDQRPTVRDLAWQSTEPNRIGTDEFIALAKKMGWTPMVTVNLGTGSPEEARNWVEYCNAPAGTRYADMRVANGHAAPYDIRLWCLGNEMDGPWQLGHVPADHYAIRAQQAGMMMKSTDRNIELVAAGSCSVDLPTYMEWDRVVLEHLGDLADFISLHRYVGNSNDDTADFLAVTNSIDKQIKEIDAVCRFVQAKNRSAKRAFLCFDEWNVWYRANSPKDTDGEGQFAPHLIEEVYNLEDALVVAGFLNSFIRHADVLKIANLAQIVNVIAPILTRDDDLLLQSIFYPLAMVARRRTGIALRTALNGPGYESPSYGYVPYIDHSAIMADDKVHLFLINRHLSEPAVIEIMADSPLSGLISGEVMTGTDPKAANRWDARDVIQAESFNNVRFENHAAFLELPPLSFVALSMQLEA